MKMKALSVQQPWASLIASGRKTIETRVWSTEYRGDLLICSSKKFIKSVMKEFQEDLFQEDVPFDYPLGMALCIAELYDCKPMTVADEEAAMCNVYGSGRWKARSFFLKNIRPVKPFPIVGELGIFEVEMTEGI